jgi:oligoendopeptidase F
MGLRIRIIAIAVFSIFVAPAARPITPEAVIDDPAQGAVWDLSPLFRDADAWEKERAAVDAALPHLSRINGTLGSSATALETGLQQISVIRQRLERLNEYANLNVAVDASSDANQARVQQMATLQSHFDEVTSFLKPEILALGRERIGAFEKADPGLSIYRRPLELILRRAAHTLNPDAEAVVTAAGPLRQQPSAIHDVLLYAEMPWPSLKVDGKMTSLTPAVNRATQFNADREIRRQAFDSVTQTLSHFEGTAGAIAFGYLAGTAFEAKVRHYPSSLALAVADDAMPETTFQVMAAEVGTAQPALLRYLKVRQKLLGFTELHVYDLRVPLATLPHRYTLDEAETLILKALAPLGEDYVRMLKNGFQNHAMHAASQHGKMPGANTEYEAYGVQPFVFLTYDGSFDSVSTVAHEWGHAINGQLTQAALPFETADIASTFVADTPSLTNEILLSDYMIANAKTRQDRISALDHAIDLLRYSYFGAFVDVEFEMKAHEIADRGEAVTGQTLNEIYCGLYKRFNGIDAGVTAFDASACAGWINRPGLYYDFYFYKYLTAVSAAAYFVDGLEKNDTATRQRYFDLLKAGGSDDPYILLKSAGFDAASPIAYQPMVRRLERLVAQLEAAVAQSIGDVPRADP